MTYSIVAHDPGTGELAVAVQSKYFQVGPIVPWALSGVGAVVTQATAEVRFGRLGLDLMQSGYSAAQALAALLAADPTPDIRQVALVDVSGGVAAHTGSRCIAAAGHRIGRRYSVQANLVTTDKVWKAMAKTFELTTGPLAERLLNALDAAEAAGGDIRGRQSAALLVVAASASEKPWEDRLIDLRVEDHAEPLGELRRLLRLHRAMSALRLGATALQSNDFETAQRSLDEALRLEPGSAQIRIEVGIGRCRYGDMRNGLPLIQTAIQADDRWLEWMRRLVPAGRIEAQLATDIQSQLATGGV